MIKISYQISPSLLSRLTAKPRLVCYQSRAYSEKEHDDLSDFCERNRISYYAVSWISHETEKLNPYFSLVSDKSDGYLRKYITCNGVKAWVRDNLGLAIETNDKRNPDLINNVRIINDNVRKGKLYEVHDEQITRLTRYFNQSVVRDLITSKTNFECDLLDREYTALPKVTLKWLLENCGFNQYMFKSTVRNCNNFSMALAALFSMKYSLNILCMVNDSSGGHSYNGGLVYNNDGVPDIVFIEPQTRKFVELGKSFSGNEFYTGEYGRIIWC